MGNGKCIADSQMSSEAPRADTEGVRSDGAPPRSELGSPPGAARTRLADCSASFSSPTLLRHSSTSRFTASASSPPASCCGYVT